GLAFRQGGCGERTGPADRSSWKRLAKPWPPALDQFEPGKGELAVSARAQFGVHQIPRNNDRAQIAAASTGDIGRNQPMIGSQQPYDHRRFPVRTSSDEDCWGADVHQWGVACLRTAHKWPNGGPAYPADRANRL